MLKRNNIEARKNIFTDSYVIFSKKLASKPISDEKPQNPFASKNEHLIDKIILEKLDDSGRFWQVRVVPNKFPIVNYTSKSKNKIAQELQVVTYPIGIHEVIVEAPFSQIDIRDFPDEAILKVVEVYAERYRAIRAKKNSTTIVITRNFGRSAGASQDHPHSQIVATDLSLNKLEDMLNAAAVYKTENNKDLFECLIQNEITNSERIVSQNKAFIAFVPFAAESPFEVWILPLISQKEFGEISSEQQVYCSNR